MGEDMFRNVEITVLKCLILLTAGGSKMGGKIAEFGAQRVLVSLEQTFSSCLHALPLVEYFVSLQMVKIAHT